MRLVLEHLHVARAERQFIYDTSGKRHMDFFTGIVTVGVGHCHPRLIQAAIQKNEKILACICILFARSYHRQASDRYVEQLEEILDHEVSNKKVAGMFIESIQGYGCSVQYPKHYIKPATGRVQQNGGLYIADEVQSGFGRTETHFWEYQGHGAKPNIAIASGFPFAAVVTRPEIAKTVGNYFNTYGGNPIGCAVASAVLDVIKEEKLQENSLQVGTHLFNSLAELRDQLPNVIGDIPGKSLLIGMEMVTDKESRKPFPVEKMNAI
ncbi:unnamed protein product [Rotaria magnacalcarata]